ncbi:hypothetical protein ACIQMJ_27115 [Actinosynnema sp. NPDC091369]
MVFATGPDGRAAENAARAVVDPASLTDIVASVAAGRLDRAFELTPPEPADRLSISGTPEECAEELTDRRRPPGLAITDAAPAKAFSGTDLPGVATMREQLRLVHDHVMPVLGVHSS